MSQPSRNVNPSPRHHVTIDMGEDALTNIPLLYSAQVHQSPWSGPLTNNPQPTSSYHDVLGYTEAEAAVFMTNNADDFEPEQEPRQHTSIELAQEAYCWSDYESEWDYGHHGGYYEPPVDYGWEPEPYYPDQGGAAAGAGEYGYDLWEEQSHPPQNGRYTYSQSQDEFRWRGAGANSADGRLQDFTRQHLGQPLRDCIESRVHHPSVRPFRNEVRELCHFIAPSNSGSVEYRESVYSYEGKSSGPSQKSHSARQQRSSLNAKPPPVPSHGTGSVKSKRSAKPSGQGTHGAAGDGPLPAPPPKSPGCCSTGVCCAGGKCCGVPFSVKNIPGIGLMKRAFSTFTGAAILGGAGIVLLLRNGGPGSTAIAGFVGVATTTTANLAMNGDDNTVVGGGTNALIAVNTVNKWGQVIFSQEETWTDIQRSCLKSGLIYKDTSDGALYAWSMRQNGLVCLEDIPKEGYKGYCKQMIGLLEERERKMKPILSSGPQLQGFSDQDYEAFNRLMLTGAVLIYTSGGQLLNFATDLSRGLAGFANRGIEHAGDAIDAGVWSVYTVVSAPVCAAIRRYFRGDDTDQSER